MTTDTTYGELDDDVTTAPAKKVRGAKTVTEETPSLSLFDQLAEVADEEIAVTAKFAVDPNRRPGNWILEFSADIDARELKAWAARAGGAKDLQKADQVKAAAFCLLDKSIGIYQRDAKEIDHPVEDSEGEILTLTSEDWLFKAMKQSPKSPNAVAALVKFLGDAAILHMSQALSRKAGYGEDVDNVADPT